MILIKKEKISNFLPQAAPFIMVDALLEQDDLQSTSSFLAGETHFFSKAGEFQVAGILENIAQTAAIRSGYSFSQLAASERKAAPVGFIGSIKKMKLNNLPKAALPILTKIIVTHTIGQINVIQGLVSQEGKEILTCEMNIFLQEQDGGES